MGTSIPLSIFTNASLNMQIKSFAKVNGPSKFNNSVRLIDLDFNRRYVTEMVNGTKGVVTVTLSGNSGMYEPQKQTVFIAGSEKSLYFENLNLTRGQLKPGGCPPRTDLMTCPEITRNISLQSSCEWYKVKKSGEPRTSGVVFAEGGNLTLPVSIAGLRYQNIEDTYTNRPFGRNKMDCEHCSNCVSANDKYCYDFTLSDAVDFINARSLAFTYIGEIQKLLPSWLIMSVNQWIQVH